MTLEDWSYVAIVASAAVTVVGFAIIIITAYFTYLHVKEASRARRLDSALAVVELISSPDLRAARRFVFQHGKALSDFANNCNITLEDIDQFIKTKSCEKVNWDSLHTYLSSLECIAILVVNDLAPDDIIEMWFGRMAPHHWRSLEPFIAFMRRLYGTDDFLQHFEMFCALLREGSLRLSAPPKVLGFFLDVSELAKRRILHNRRLMRKEQDSRLAVSAGR